MISTIRSIFAGISGAFGLKKKNVKIGLYGPPNSGKTTLANTICKEIIGTDEEFGKVSSIAHETRSVNIKEKLTIKNKRKSIEFDLIDTPGIATRIDYEKFLKSGMSEREAKQRAKEATKGVIESIKWLDNIDVVVIVLDSTKNPYNQVNLTILGNLEARKIPVLVVANKIDLKSSKLQKVQDAFPKYKVIGISAKFSQNTQQLYEELVRCGKSARRR